MMSLSENGWPASSSTARVRRHKHRSCSCKQHGDLWGVAIRYLSKGLSYHLHLKVLNVEKFRYEMMSPILEVREGVIAMTKESYFHLKRRSCGDSKAILSLKERLV